MSGWTNGLPPAAHDRVARQRASGTAGSLFSAPAAAAAKSAGLVPIGEVFGSLVMNLGWSGTGCNFYGMYGRGGAGGFGGGGFNGGGGFAAGGLFGGNMMNYQTPVTTSGDHGGYAGFAPYVKAFEHGWHGAIQRMLAEALALGAEGVVGVKVSRVRIDQSAYEFAAIGTAVRSVDTSLVARPREGTVWYANLSAEDCASAIHSGFQPSEMALGLSVATKHEDYVLKQQRSSWAGNQEIEGLTLLVNAARHDARNQLVARARRDGGAGADLVITNTDVTEFETPCGEEIDLHAEAVFIGTILVPGPMRAFRTRDRPGSAAVTTVLPLSDPGVRTRRYR
ncbi:heavy metal-binding domain-containing protein [Frondihabitans australicus]|uniref:heavy metal-binding domain-containing protein n=1 Tax=Frondihabitans australicus TaxID=386892 RepID=UPI0011C462CE|nr:heavy metal-binding domain-containing protein [Frondihabitans australicus]